VPKVVDHEERRRELAAAVWRISADRGLEAASLREVAAEAGWSLGALRHYFPSRDELVLFAFELVAQRGGARIERAVAEGGGERAVLRRMLLETLPLDEERRVECRVWFAFTVQAEASQALRAVRAEVYEEIITALSRHLDGFTRRGLTAGRAAVLLWAAADGIALQGLAVPGTLTPARQRAALEAQLDLVLAS